MPLFYPNPALRNIRRKASEVFSNAKDGSFSKEQSPESFAPRHAFDPAACVASLKADGRLRERACLHNLKTHFSMNSVVDESVALDQPSESNSGRYWYNLHVVLLVADRARFRNEADFIKLDRALVATATKHQYQLAVRAWMPDHLHVALRSNIADSPAEIALSLMNNTAFTMQNQLRCHTR